MKTAFVLFILLVLSSCVGTVEQSTSTMTDTQTPVADIIKFSGVNRVVAISDTRLEVFFNKATGGSGKYVYEFYIGEQPVQYVPSDVFEATLNELKYTVTNLELATDYSVRVEVRDASVTDPKLAPRSNNQKYVTAKTFTHEVCNFNGISSVENMPGEDGRNSLRIRWSPAAIISPTTAPRAPLSYEIVLLKDGIASGPLQGTGDTVVNAQFDNQTLLPINGRYSYIVTYFAGLNETVVTGLTPNYSYKVRVRCLHRASINDSFDLSLRSELNSNIIRWSTLSEDAPVYDSRQIKFELLNGAEGFSGIRATWGQVIGAFSHFRTYATLSPFNENMIQAICKREEGCEQTSYNKNESIVTGLTAKQLYYTTLVICLTSNCSQRVKAKEGTLTTEPIAARVTGVQDLELYYDLENFGAVKLKIDPPDLSSGHLDDYLIEFRKGLSADRQWMNAEEEFTIDPYDIKTAREITLRGLTFGTNQDVFEFKVSGRLGNAISRPAPEPVTSVNLSGASGSSFAGPNKDNFKGIKQVTVNSFGTGLINIAWEMPRAGTGFYTHYDFYLSNCTTCNPIDPSSNAFIYSIYRDSIETVPSSCSPVTRVCQQTFSVSEDSRIRIGLATSFISPLISGGMLPVVSNTCYWDCQTVSGNFTCNLAGSCQ
jgi:hypothetical protein